MIKGRLLRVMEKQAFDILQELIWQFLGLLAQLVLVGCIAVLISDFYYRNVTAKIVILAVILSILLVLARALFIKFYFDAKKRASEHVTNTLREKIIEKTFRFGSSFGELASPVKLSELLTENVDSIEAYYSEFLGKIAYAALGTTAMLMVLFACDTTVAGILCAVFILAIIAFALIIKRDNFLSLNILKTLLQAASYVGACLAFISAISDLAKGEMKLYWAIITFYVCLEIFKPFIEMADILPEGLVGAKATDEVLAFLNARDPKGGKADLDNERIRVVLSGLTFGYGKESIIDSATMIVPVGNAISIYGAKGSGKSTLVGILTKKNRAYKGSIKINGKELSVISEASLYDKIAYISSDCHLFKKTIKENLLIANPKADDKRMISALTIVNLWHDLKGKGGLEFSLEENELTIGQRQRLLMARALLKNAKLYIFDDVLKDVDEESKKVILKLMQQLSREMGRTVLHLSSDINVLKHVDKIYQLEEGVIKEYERVSAGN